MYAYPLLTLTLIIPLSISIINRAEGSATTSSSSSSGIRCYHGQSQCRGQDCLKILDDKKTPIICSSLPDGMVKDYDICWSTWTMASDPKSRKRKRKLRSVYRGCLTTAEMSGMRPDIQVEMGSCHGVELQQGAATMIHCYCDWDGCNGDFTPQQIKLVQRALMKQMTFAPHPPPPSPPFHYYDDNKKAFNFNWTHLRFYP